MCSGGKVPIGDEGAWFALLHPEHPGQQLKEENQPGQWWRIPLIPLITQEAETGSTE